MKIFLHLYILFSILVVYLTLIIGVYVVLKEAYPKKCNLIITIISIPLLVMWILLCIIL